MKCPKCNEEIADGAKFCTKCGANIEEESTDIQLEPVKVNAISSFCEDIVEFVKNL